MKDPRLQGPYLVTDNGRTPSDQLVTTVGAAIRGGVRIVQYRDKSNDHARRLREAAALRALTSERGVLFLVNDDIALAEQVAADGIHLGINDAGVEEGRIRLGSDAVIGVSCYDRFDLAQKAASDGADYLAFGSFFASRVKPNAPRASLDLLRESRDKLTLPICAIGGITAEQAPSLVAAGADMVAVISAIFGAEDAEAAARALTAAFEDHRG
ncbi:MAG: thiamine phosphate synthase [Halothiobacillaceae bacterium]